MKNYKLIGQGSFSKVYRRGTGNNVLIISKDNVKECMSMGWFPASPLFPTVKHIGDNDNGSMYTMKYYAKVTAPKKQLNKKSHELYEALRNIHCMPYNIHDSYHVLIKEIGKLPNKFKHQKELIVEAIDALTNYGSDIGFEISPRNIAVTKTGKLILLDCFFFKSELIKIRS